MTAYLVTSRVNPEQDEDLSEWVAGEPDESEDANRVQRAMRKGHRSGDKWYFTLEGSEREIRALVADVLADDVTVERLVRIEEKWTSHRYGEDDGEED